MPTGTERNKKVEYRRPRRVRYRGLCMTCFKAPTCTFPRDPERPVLQCDEFEGYPESSKGAVTLDHVSESPSKVVKEAGDEQGKYKGLCKICEKRETCTFPKPETGVWHCEEYE